MLRTTQALSSARSIFEMNARYYAERLAALTCRHTAHHVDVKGRRILPSDEDGAGMDGKPTGPDWVIVTTRRGLSFEAHAITPSGDVLTKWQPIERWGMLNYLYVPVCRRAATRSRACRAMLRHVLAVRPESVAATVPTQPNVVSTNG